MVDVEEPSPEVAETKFRIVNLTKESDAGVPILNGINAEIPKGVIVGIIGPSGSGKSTMLRALNRLWEPPFGTVFLDGRDIRDLDVLTLRRKVGMLFQLPALFEGMLMLSGANCFFFGLFFSIMEVAKLVHYSSAVGPHGFHLQKSNDHDNLKKNRSGNQSELRFKNAITIN